MLPYIQETTTYLPNFCLSKCRRKNNNKLVTKTMAPPYACYIRSKNAANIQYTFSSERVFSLFFLKQTGISTSFIMT